MHWLYNDLQACKAESWAPEPAARHTYLYTSIHRVWQEQTVHDYNVASTSNKHKHTAQNSQWTLHLSIAAAK